MVSKETGVQKRFVELVLKHEEEAQFSKMLATIRLDSPINFVLPERHWLEDVKKDETLALFNELGFRTLTARFKTLLNIEAEEQFEGGDLSAQDLKVAAVMLWLIESDRTNPTADDIIDYARSVYGLTDISDILKKFEEELRRQELWDVYEKIEKPLIPVLDKVNQTGIKLDTEYLAKLSKTFRKELSSLEKEIHSHAGQDFNINSPKQLGDIIYDKLGLKPKRQKKTAGGARSTRESELSQMKDDHPIINAILRYRELSKLVSTYVDNLPPLVKEDGRLRTTFLQTGTVTGRIGSRDPNLQNIPVRTEEGRAVRQAFVAEKGYKLLSIDYSQIELRIAAFLSGDQKMIEIFQGGQDVHSAVASRVFGVKENEVTPDMRRRAKVINFGILYGMGVNALRANLGEDTSREEAQEFLNAYFNTFTRLAEYLEETKAYAREHGFTKTLFGRRRYFPGIQSSAPFLRASAERMAINAPIQGTEGDILRIAMVNIDNYLNDNNLNDVARTLLQVHDELVFEIKDEKLDELAPRLADIMREVFSGYDIKDVPIEVEAKVGDNWSQMTKFKLS